MSRCLAERSIDHVVLERGEVANTWRTERWDSLRLLTPELAKPPARLRLQRRRPGRLSDRAGGHPIHRRLRQGDLGPGRNQHAGDIRPQQRHRLSGADRPRRLAMPGRRAGVGRVQHPRHSRVCRCRCRYRSPASPPSSTAIPPSLRTAACWWWALRRAAPRSPMRSSARAARSICRSASTSARRACTAARISSGGWTPPACTTSAMTRSTTSRGRGGCPSLQLAGTTDRSTLDLNALTDNGVTLIGRLAGIANGKAQFAGSLRNMCALSDLKMNRLLETIDIGLTLGRASTASMARSSRRIGCRPRGSRTRRRSASTSPAGRSRRSSGPPAIGRTTHGSNCRCSTAREWSAMTAASPICRAFI